MALPVSPQQTADAELAASARTVLSVARRRLAGFTRLTVDEREDAVQQAVMRVLEAIEAGTVTNIEAFTRRVAFHCAVDALRAKRREPRPSGNGPPDDIPPPSSNPFPDPEKLLGEKQRVLSLKEIGPHLEGILAAAPERYRLVIQQHYFEGQSLDSIARAQLDEGSNPVDAAELQRAHNRVHAWHARAVRWLQARLVEAWRKGLE